MCVHSLTHSAPPTCRQSLDAVVDAVETFVKQHKQTVVAVDGVAEAIAAGVRPRTMLVLLHRLKAMTEGRCDGSSLVFHAHADALHTASNEGSEGDPVESQLAFVAHTVLTATALSTGASVAVDGEVRIRVEEGREALECGVEAGSHVVDLTDTHTQTHTHTHTHVAVLGCVALQLRCCVRGDGQHVVAADRAVHFKAKDSGVALFPIGSAAGLL